eukprot:Nk52_evm19s2118 gene=Nk52_evmTU19s2118
MEVEKQTGITEGKAASVGALHSLRESGDKILPTRVSPGNIYIQTFDAEVGLVVSLGKERNYHALPQQTGMLPLSRVTGKFLNEGQKEWLKAQSNDNITQNPVYRKYSKNVDEKLARPSLSYIALREVRGLTGNILSAVSTTGYVGIDNMNANRKERHEAIVQGFHRQISEISMKLQDCVKEYISEAQKALPQYGEIINKVLTDMESDETLAEFDHSTLDQLWTTVESQFPKRKVVIDLLSDNLEKVEQTRAHLCAEAIQELIPVLKKSGYLLPETIQRFIEDEVEEINKCLVQNRKTYAELRARQLATELDMEMTNRLFWEERVEKWRNLRHSLCLERVKAFVNSPEAVSPQARIELFASLKVEYREVFEKLLDTVDYLKQSRPPTFTRSVALEWSENVKTIMHDIENVNVRYIGMLMDQDAVMDDKCRAMVRECKEELLVCQVYPEAELEVIIHDHFMPLLEWRHRQSAHLLRHVEYVMTEHNTKLHEKVNQFIAWVVSAGTLWSDVDKRIKDIEDLLQGELETLRFHHDAENQEKESQLDAIMDEMRQDYTESLLSASLGKSLHVLEQIESSYHNFHQRAVSIARSHPTRVEEGLKEYDEKICDFFGLSRNPIAQEKPKSSQSAGRTGRRMSVIGAQGSVVGGHVDKFEAGALPQVLRPVDGFQKVDTSKRRMSLSAIVDAHSAAVILGEKQLRSHSSPRNVKCIEDKTVVTTNIGTVFYIKPKPSTKDNSLSGSQSNSKGGQEESLDDAISDKRTAEWAAKHGNANAKLEDTVKKGTESPSQADPGAIIGKESTLAESPSPLLLEGLEGEEEEEAEMEVFDDELPLDPFGNSYFDKLMIDESFFDSIKKVLRRAFLNHMEEWGPHVVVAAANAVSSKCEELNNELDLRLYLHQPRSSRAQEDVHNVRACEILQHKERVKRHIIGVHRAIEELKQSLEETQKRSETIVREFAAELASGESKLSSAGSVLMLQKVQKAYQQKGQMAVTRLKKNTNAFRQVMDSVMDSLKQSGIDLAEAFTLFSDGGNFSQEEIEGFRQQLQKLSIDIDSSEMTLLTALESDYNKHKLMATQKMTSFEEKYNGHEDDVKFYENVNKRIGNAKVKIRGQMCIMSANEDRISEQLDELDNLLRICSREPDVDEILHCQQSIIITIFNHLDCIRKEVYTRAMSLECLVSSTKLIDLTSIVNEITDYINEWDKGEDYELHADELNCILETRDAENMLMTVNEKSLCQRRKGSKTFAAGGPTRAETSHSTGSGSDKHGSSAAIASAASALGGSKNGSQANSNGSSKQNSKNNSKSSLQNIDVVDESEGNQNPPSTGPGINQGPLGGPSKESGQVSQSDAVRRDSSILAQTIAQVELLSVEADRGHGKGRETSLSQKSLIITENVSVGGNSGANTDPMENKGDLISPGIKPNALSPLPPRESSGTPAKSKVVRRKADFFVDDKSLPIISPEYNAFMAKIKSIIDNAVVEIEYFASQYYSMRTGRANTRPNTIPETYDLFRQSLIQRLNELLLWTHQMRSESVRKFRSQLRRLCSKLERVPEFIFDHIRVETKKMTAFAREMIIDHLKGMLLKYEHVKLQQQDILKPVFGKSNNRQQLDELLDVETKRNKSAKSIIQNHAVAAYIVESKYAMNFTNQLLAVSFGLFRLFDTTIMTHDLAGEALDTTLIPKKKSMIRLIKEKERKDRAATANNAGADATKHSGQPLNYVDDETASVASGKAGGGNAASHNGDAEEKSNTATETPGTPTSLSSESSTSVATGGVKLMPTNVQDFDKIAEAINQPLLKSYKGLPLDRYDIDNVIHGDYTTEMSSLYSADVVYNEESDYELASGQECETVSGAVTAKLTTIHQAVYRARNAAFHSYCQHFRSELAEVAKVRDNLLKHESQYINNWRKVVQNIRSHADRY